MTPIGALTLAILAGLVLGLAITWYMRRGTRSRPQLVQRTHLASALAMIAMSISCWIGVASSSRVSTTTVVLGAATGIYGVGHLVWMLRSRVVKTDD